MMAETTMYGHERHMGMSDRLHIRMSNLDPGGTTRAFDIRAGTILAVDGQSGKLEKWPPSKNGLGFDESQMSGSDAIYFTADGEVVRDDHP